MTVSELIAELQKYPQDKIVEIGTITTTYGFAVRVVEWENTVEIESNEE